MAHVCMEGSLNEDGGCILFCFCVLCILYLSILYLLNVVKSYEMFAVCCEL